MKNPFQTEHGMGPWWVFSLLLHLALFASLFFLLPAAPPILPSEDAPALASSSPDKVRQVAEDIRARESDSLRAKVDELQRLREEMAALQKEAFERLDELNQNKAEEARQRLDEAQKQAVLAQEDAIRKLAESDLDAARAAQEKAVQAQQEALKALESPGATPDPEIRTAQLDAIQAQKEANAARETAHRAAPNPTPTPPPASQTPTQTTQNTQNPPNKPTAATTATAPPLPSSPAPATAPITPPDSAAAQAALEKSKAAQAAALASQKRAQASSATPASIQPITPPAPGKAEIDAARTVPDLYNTARLIEEALTTSYQDARAAELAALQNLTIEEARKLTQTTLPERPDLDEAALTGDLTQASGLQKQEQAILTARKEVAGMLAQANSILGQVRPAEGGVSVTADSLRSRSNHARAMEQAASASDGTPARDLTGLMTQGGKGSGAGGGAIPQDTTTGPAGSQGGPPKLPPRTFQAVPGRRLVSGPASIQRGKDGSWMFLDSWYLIGPWPNENRRNLDTKFPPESLINLDAVYQNESGKKLAWRFHQSEQELIKPPGLGEYQIYYAFTEIWSETACDRWIAIGSDDQSKIWINDDLVWKSSDDLKGWNPGEGLRKVRLKQGNNRILVRLENGHLAGGFSIIVKMEN